MTAIIEGVKVTWSDILFGIFKNIFQSSKQSKGFTVQLSYIIDDSGVAIDTKFSPHKYKVFNDASVISHNTHSATLTVSPAQLIQVKKEIGEEKEKEKAQSIGKKASKASKTISIVVPKPKTKRKLVVE